MSYLSACSRHAKPDLEFGDPGAVAIQNYWLCARQTAAFRGRLRCTEASARWLSGQLAYRRSGYYAAFPHSLSLEQRAWQERRLGASA